MYKIANRGRSRLIVRVSLSWRINADIGAAYHVRDPQGVEFAEDEQDQRAPVSSPPRPPPRCGREQRSSDCGERLHTQSVSPLDEAEFESLLDQVRDLHRRTDELARSKSRLHEHIRAELRWERKPPTIPSEQRALAERVVEILSKPRLSSSQARRLYETYFGRR